jgi:hypothetical protein
VRHTLTRCAAAAAAASSAAAAAAAAADTRRRCKLPGGMRQVTHIIIIPNQRLQSAALPPLFTSVPKGPFSPYLPKCSKLVSRKVPPPPPPQEPRSRATARLNTRPLCPPLFEIASLSRTSQEAGRCHQGKAITPPAPSINPTSHRSIKPNTKPLLNQAASHDHALGPCQ